MKNSNEIILDLINRNASINEICEITNLSHKQLFYRINMLKIKGYDFRKKYYYNGDIVYDLRKDVNNTNKNEVTILTNSKDKEFKAVFISDIHLGHINDRPDLLENVYDFCTKKGINIIINAGDIIDGPVGCGSIHYKRITDVEEQINNMLKKYPFDKNIINFLCLGNHDYYALKETGLDIHKILNNKRHDLVSVGYEYSVINVKNDAIIVRHPIELEERQHESIANRLNIIGHSHRTKSVQRDNQVNMWIPSLSDIMFNDGEGIHKQLPSMLVANISFRNGWFDVGNFEQYIFLNKEILRVNEMQCDLIKGKDMNQTTIINEETRKPFSKKEYLKNVNLQNILETGVLTHQNESVEQPKTYRLNAVERFYKRYNIEKK